MASNPDTSPCSVAFLGPVASYCHQAAKQAFSLHRVSLTPYPTIASVFAAVQSNSTDYGVVPIENSTDGYVPITQDLLASAISREALTSDEVKTPFPDVRVCGETEVEVKHCLLGHLPPKRQVELVEDGTDNGLSHIKTVYTHPQAWGQCTKILSGYLKKTEKIDTTSTAKAAEIVATASKNDELGCEAAISSHLAAETYGLEILEADIQDEDNNFTRFYVLQNHTQKAKRSVKLQQMPPNGLMKAYDIHEPSAINRKALVTFAVSSSARSLALSEVLTIFVKNSFKLTSINARPSGIAPWNFVFIVEFLYTDRQADGTSTSASHAYRALGELANTTKMWKWFGSWEIPLAHS